MNEISEKLITLRNYFMSNRRVGHSCAMLKGAEQKDCIVIVGHMEQGKRQFSSLPPDRIFVSIHNLDSLRGLQKPMVFDNYALEILFSEASVEIAGLRAEVKRWRDSAKANLRIL